MTAYIVAAAAAGWVALLVAAPFLSEWPGALLYGVGSVICHQIPERSFHLAGAQLPVCARCLGLYAGGMLGLVGHLRLRATAAHAALSAVRRSTARRLVALAAVPTALTVLLEAADLWAPSNATRALAGALLTCVVGLVVMATPATLHYDGCVPPRPTAPRPPPPST